VQCVESDDCGVRVTLSCFRGCLICWRSEKKWGGCWAGRAKLDGLKIWRHRVQGDLLLGNVLFDRRSRKSSWSFSGACLGVVAGVFWSGRRWKMYFFGPFLQNLILAC
jgi:hypothetical protein